VLRDSASHAEHPQVAQAAGGANAAPIGRVDTISGTVTAQHVDGSVATLEAGASVYQKDLITTQGGAKVALVFADKTTFALGEAGQMRLDELIYNPAGKDGKLAVSMLKGAFAFVSGDIAATQSDAMTVRTPVGTIGIRGTAVNGNVDPAGGGSFFAAVPDPSGAPSIVTFTNAAGTQIFSENMMVSVGSFFAAPSVPFSTSGFNLGEAGQLAFTVGAISSTVNPGGSSSGAPAGGTGQPQTQGAPGEGQSGGGHDFHPTFATAPQFDQGFSALSSLQTVTPISSYTGTGNSSVLAVVTSSHTHQDNQVVLSEPGFVGTLGVDNFRGTAGADLFDFSKVPDSLQSTDTITGGGGADTLRALLDKPFTIAPTITDVPNIHFTLSASGTVDATSITAAVTAAGRSTALMTASGAGNLSVTHLKIDFNGSALSGNESLSADAHGLRMVTGAGNDTIIAAGSGSAPGSPAAHSFSASSSSSTSSAPATTIIGGAGTNLLEGGGGDALDYSAAPGAVTVNFAQGMAIQNGYGGSDLISGFDAVTGSAFSDSINVALGTGSFVVVDGGAGNNTLTGSFADTDALNYARAPAGVAVDFVAGTVANGYGGTDQISGFSEVIGSAFDDTFRTANATLVVEGNGGVDTVMIAGTNNNLVLFEIDHVESGNAAAATTDIFMVAPPDGYTVDLSGQGGTLLVGVTGNLGAITGNNNADTISLFGDGNHIMLGNGANVVDIESFVDPATGIGVVSAFNAITVGNGNNHITISGNGGDVITAGNGNNLLQIGGHGEEITVGAGNNGIVINGGAAFVATGSGANTIDITGGGNAISVGNGNNAITITGGDDTISFGGGVNDVFVSGADNAISGTGNGMIDATGGGNAITINASLIDDVITVGGAGNVLTVTGSDDFIGVDGSVTGTITGIFNLVDLSGSGDSVTLHLTGDDDLVSVTGSGNTDVLFLSGDDDIVSVTGSSNIVLADNGFADDTIYVMGNSNVFELTGDDDFTAVLVGGGGDTIVVAGAADLVNFSDSDDEMVIVSGDHDTVNIGNGNDTILVSGGHDSVNFGTGDDLVTVTGGDDYLDDSMSVGSDTITVSIGGADTVVVSNNDDFIWVYGAGHDSISAGFGDDTIYFLDAGNDTFTAAGGDDSIFISADDQLSLGTGSNYIQFGSSDMQLNLTINGSFGSDTIGVNGEDTMFVHANDDFIFIQANANDDRLYLTGTGNTVELADNQRLVVFDGGNNQYNGDGALDTLVVGGTGGADAFFGCGGTLSFAGAPAGVMINLDPNAGPVYAKIGAQADDAIGGFDVYQGSANNDTLVGFGTVTLEGGGAGDDHFVVGNNAPIITLSYQDVAAGIDVDVDFSTGTATHGGFTDTLDTTNGPFYGVIGGGGNDTIDVSSGADFVTVEGGAGNNSLVGNGCDDVLSYAQAPFGVAIQYDGLNGTASGAYGAFVDTIQGFNDFVGTSGFDSLSLFAGSCETIDVTVTGFEQVLGSGLFMSHEDVTMLGLGSSFNVQIDGELTLELPGLNTFIFGFDAGHSPLVASGLDLDDTGLQTASSYNLTFDGTVPGMSIDASCIMGTLFVDTSAEPGTAAFHIIGTPGGDDTILTGAGFNDITVNDKSIVMGGGNDAVHLNSGGGLLVADVASVDVVNGYIGNVANLTVTGTSEIPNIDLSGDGTGNVTFDLVGPSSASFFTFTGCGGVTELKGVQHLTLQGGSYDLSFDGSFGSPMTIDGSGAGPIGFHDNTGGFGHFDVLPGSGADVLNGGVTDTLDYHTSASPVTLTITSVANSGLFGGEFEASSTVAGAGGTAVGDTFTNFGHLVGSGNGDTLVLGAGVGAVNLQTGKLADTLADLGCGVTISGFSAVVGNGAATITGSTGGNSFTANGADNFVYTAYTDSFSNTTTGDANTDHILNFQTNTTIDLTGGSLATGQTFVGAKTFNTDLATTFAGDAAGQVDYTFDGTNTYVHLTNAASSGGYSSADVLIQLSGHPTLTSANFHLH
jgi:hypothetical protein